MSSNRFDFLEFGKDAEDSGELAFPEVSFSAPEEIASTHPVRSDAPPALAEVRETDVRGYQSFLENTQSEVTVSSSPEFEIKEVIGSPGTRAGQFNYPTGIAIDTDGVLFIADSYNHRLQRITSNGDVAIIGARGSGHGQFLSPQGIAVDSRRSFYVVEQGNHRVQKFSADGVCLLVFGRHGHKAGEFRGPTSIAVAPGTGDIYIADTGNARVQRFDSEGRFISTLGSHQVTAHSLGSPQSLSTDILDNVYVVDLSSHRVVQYDPTGRLARNYFGATEHIAVAGLSRFESPRSAAVDSTGVIYIGDNRSALGANSGSLGRLHALDLQSGRALSCITKVNRGVGSLSVPGGIACAPRVQDFVGKMGRTDVFVADTSNHRILRFGWK